ncbi:YceI family protein [Corallincola holothuriorum]|uniref:YceI family protein n=1 Tax=Corallincola holothuriorum TaxID=2282215 RepID=A0A368NRW5_9GAMM|nr:YceI family protein [Corallincola holothuriorum]RCU52916.1 YceI family protein [Corallincola holothuriorum]
MKSRFLIWCLALFISAPVLAEWQLMNDQSVVSFVSIKKNSVGEVHQFKQISGSVAESGAVNLVIDLSSVETNIPIRNDRMKELLFEVASFATADASGVIPISRLSAMKAGDSYNLSVPLRLSLHGKEKQFTAELTMTRLSKDRLLVTSFKPVVISAKDFNLETGIEALRKIANLSDIATAVPVSVSLVFQRQRRVGRQID